MLHRASISFDGVLYRAFERWFMVRLHACGGCSMSASPVHGTSYVFISERGGKLQRLQELWMSEGPEGQEANARVCRNSFM